MPPFEVVSSLRPAGDQPKAIAALSKGVGRGDRYQTLLGITGSGKTATIAWTIEEVQKPTLIIEPNKSLAAQLSAELRELFPKNRVEYFVSYYDYYQPEAYLPSTDTYIEKDSSINDEIDRFRHASTSSLLLRADTIVVASVSCIYGLGSPDEYRDRILTLTVGEDQDQRTVLRRLVDLHYDRNNTNLVRGTFRARGDTIEIHPAYERQAVRVEMFGDTVERIVPFDVMTGEMGEEMEDLVVFAASHYVAGDQTMRRAIESIEVELGHRLTELQEQNKLLEVQRLRARTEHDLEMLAETGTCSGVENYSRHLDGRRPGETPHTLLDFFPRDYLVVLDESHVAVPQLRGQFAGDRSRKEVLVEHGFRLPSALDNRPLMFDEFVERVPQCIFLSATPGTYELEHSQQVVEQLIRPTGLVDPEVVIQPTTGQVDDLLGRIEDAAAAGGRVLVTTLTKKMAEDLTDYLADAGVKVQYLHSDIDTFTRIEILRELRLGTIDVLVGINLLREGLDLPEVSLVAILDADKEGFLRSESSLIQTMGRAARNVDGQVVLYADTITDSMRAAVSETLRRREAQTAYNIEHGIEPSTIRKSVSDILEKFRAAGQEIPGRRGRTTGRADARSRQARAGRLAGVRGTPLADPAGNEWVGGPGALPEVGDLSDPGRAQALQELIEQLRAEMQAAAADLRFEEAALLRDELSELQAVAVAARERALGPATPDPDTPDPVAPDPVAAEAR